MPSIFMAHRLFRALYSPLYHILREPVLGPLFLSVSCLPLRTDLECFLAPPRRHLLL